MFIRKQPTFCDPLRVVSFVTYVFVVQHLLAFSTCLREHTGFVIYTIFYYSVSIKKTETKKCMRIKSKETSCRTLPLRTLSLNFSRESSSRPPSVLYCPLLDSFLNRNHRPQTDLIDLGYSSTSQPVRNSIPIAKDLEGKIGEDPSVKVKRFLSHRHLSIVGCECRRLTTRPETTPSLS